MMKILTASLWMCAALLGVSAATARPLVPAEQRDAHYTGLLPFCDHPRVLAEINSAFRSRENNEWSSGLSIVGFQYMHEIGYRSTGVDYTPRRYCRALVFLSDHKARDMSYSIGERDGVIGLSWGTEWCISGLDRNYAFGLDCRSARP